MEIVAKKTTELTDKELQDISALFVEVFEKERDAEFSKRQYMNNPFGTSYHAMMYEDGKLVGHDAGIPQWYIVNGKKVKCLNNIDLMISKNCRGIVGFMGLMKAAYKLYTQEDVKFLLSMPNKNSYPLLKKLKYMEDVAPLNTYILPYRVGGVKPALGFANILSKLFCHLWVNVSSLFASNEVIKFAVHKDLETFNEHRYKRFDGVYQHAEYKGSRFVYKVMDYEGINAAFLVDVFEKSARNFALAAKYILKHEGDKFDVLLYVGNLPFGCNGFVKVPHKFEPKRFNFVSHIFDKEFFDEDDKKAIFDLNSWDVNLSDDDVL